MKSVNKSPISAEQNQQPENTYNILTQETFEPADSVTNPETIRAREIGEVMKNPDVVGINFDSDSIVYPERRRQIQHAQDFLATGGTLEQLSEHYSQQLGRNISPSTIQETINEENNKMAIFKQELSKLPDGAKMRIHPNGTTSPFTVSECIHTDVDQQKTVTFDPVALQQIEMLKNKAGDTGLTVVMNQWTKETAGDIPQTPEEITDYALLCREFIKQTHFENGKNLTLELGNETNVNRHTQNADGTQIFDNPNFGDSSSPEQYADFYYQVAHALKTEFPDLKLSVAGTAFYDPAYLEKVVDNVQSRQTGLIDVISFHPYRETAEGGTAEITKNEIGSNNLSFDEQFSQMQQIAQKADAEVTVGEVSFCKPDQWGQSVNTVEQSHNSDKMRELGATSYLWPGNRLG